ncbi:uncharacterized protein LOC110964118 isoform X2 [Acanthochromis polyacanthus]|uniref:uncharacterized protein LOC110964118 isoform X2 n=1 Tax=Acanthochromis polyacanthus TaxID=80966 RepID=UPI002234070D|nr:uncharacterized protein LOC110964118 isoform X2 [Acanthochromis polyacanthus]
MQFSVQVLSSFARLGEKFMPKILALTSVRLQITQKQNISQNTSSHRCIDLLMLSSSPTDTHMLWSVKHGRGWGQTATSLEPNFGAVSGSLERVAMDFYRQYVLLLLIGMILISFVIIFIFFLINKCISRRGKHKISHLERRAVVKADSNKYQERNPDVVNPPLPPRTQFLTAEAQSYENLAEVSDYEQCTADYEQSTDQQPDYVKVEEEEEILPPPPYDHPGPGMTAGVAGLSYENLAEEHDYEQSTDQQPDYVQLEEEEILPSPPPYNHPGPGMTAGVAGLSYENLAEEHDYEQSTDQQPDYVQLEEEEILPPPPPYNHPGPGMTAGVAVLSYENLAEEPDYEESLDQQLDYVQVEDEAKTLFPHPADPAADNSSTEDYDDIGEDQGEEDYDDVG